MSEEKTWKMGASIGKRVRNYLIFFAILILLQIWWEELLRSITDSLSNEAELGILNKIITSILTLIGAIALIILNLGRDVDLHNLLDKKLFHVRSRTGEIIRREMIKAAESVQANGYENMSKKERQNDVMYLFYHFVNEQEVLRALAFTYWEQYFVNLYIIIFSILGLLFSLGISLLRWELDWAAFIPFLFLFIGIGVGLQTQSSLVKKLYDLPKQQIQELKSSKSVELKKEVEARFG